MKHCRLLVLFVCISVALVQGDSATTDKKPEPKLKSTRKQSVVYSYSTATTTDEGPKMSQLTIATGLDGKYHYVKNENGTTKSGIWTGPLPATPDVEKLAAAAVSEFTTSFTNPELKDLSFEIDSSIQDYLKKALASE